MANDWLKLHAFLLVVINTLVKVDREFLSFHSFFILFLVLGHIIPLPNIHCA
jgi:hypothetical protein